MLRIIGGPTSTPKLVDSSTARILANTLKYFIDLAIHRNISFVVVAIYVSITN
jgi:hypothetical protein